MPSQTIVRKVRKPRIWRKVVAPGKRWRAPRAERTPGLVSISAGDEPSIHQPIKDFRVAIHHCRFIAASMFLSSRCDFHAHCSAILALACQATTYRRFAAFNLRITSKHWPQVCSTLRIPISQPHSLSSASFNTSLP